MTAVRIPVRQGSPEWLDARRSLITATDVGAILGLSPWRCEADVAASKTEGAEQPDSLAMRKGSFLEPFILDEYQRQTGQRAVRLHGLYRHPVIEWAAASPDAETRGGIRRLVEIKHSGSRSRWADGLPQDYEAQVRWQMGVMGHDLADVAALVGDTLTVYPVEHDPAVFADLVRVAEDFRSRLRAGGPFAQSAESVKRLHPADDGSEVVADAEVAEAVRTLVATREQRKALESAEEALETAIKTRMGDAAVMHGDGWDITWRRTRDRAETDWRALGADLLDTMPETERAALVGRHTAVRAGFRPLRITAKGE